MVASKNRVATIGGKASGGGKTVVLTKQQVAAAGEKLGEVSSKLKGMAPAEKAVYARKIQSGAESKPSGNTPSITKLGKTEGSRSSQKIEAQKSAISKAAKKYAKAEPSARDLRKLAGLDARRVNIEKREISKQQRDLVGRGMSKDMAAKEAERIVKSQIKKGYFSKELNAISKQRRDILSKAGERKLSRSLASL